jgi:hypothetical protein
MSYGNEHNKTLMLRAFYFVAFLSATNLFAQEVPIGHWRDHLPYTKVLSVAITPDKVYAATEVNLFTVDKADQSIERLSTINGLSDNEISHLRYSEANNILLIAYKSANIDLVKNNTIINIPDIKNKQLVGNKIINSVFFSNDLAYLACGFGIVVLDLKRMEIKDTYYIGPNGNYINVNEITSDGSNLYAATENGVYSASLSSVNLSDFTSWSKFASLPAGNYISVGNFDDKIHACFKSTNFGQDTIYRYENGTWDKLNFFNIEIKNVFYNKEHLGVVTYGSVYIFYPQFNLRYVGDYSPSLKAAPLCAAMAGNGDLWIGDNKHGLIKNSPDGHFSQFLPNGPDVNSVFRIAASGGTVVATAGALDGSFNNTYNVEGFFSFRNNTWKTMNATYDPALSDVRDMLAVAIDPANAEHYFIGTWFSGIIEYQNDELKTFYTPANSTLQYHSTWANIVDVAGMAFDTKGNLWVVNSNVSAPLSVKKTDGTWKSFDFGAVASNRAILDVVVDQQDQKWFVMPRSGIGVFNDNNTIDNISDDQFIKLAGGSGNGNLPDIDVTSLAVDKEGVVWIGTAKGLAVFYNPSSVFDHPDAEQIIITKNGNSQILLGSQAITSIAVDEANRKWIGTRDAGVFFVSADGGKELLHFDKDNSPLFSNHVNCIAINHENGEVFIGTDKGIISYKGTATIENEELNNVYAYPNPVKSDYDGLIAIKGLDNEMNVKITDISGKLIYETTSLGGQAIWNGKDYNGDRVKSGVYLVFNTNSDGSKTNITKILFIN